MTAPPLPLALVTGAARGIGRAIADRLARDGFEVIVLDRDGASAEAAAAEICGMGHAARAAAVDLTDKAAVAALIAAERPLAALVNNAGIFDERTFYDLSPEDFRRMYEVNLVALFTLSQAAAARMRPGAKIVNISSRVFLGARNHAHYVASKAAVVGLTRAMAMELAGQGILVNSIAPGLIHAAAAGADTGADGGATGAPTHRQGRTARGYRQRCFLPCRTGHGFHHRADAAGRRRQVTRRRDGNLAMNAHGTVDAEHDVIVVGSGAGGMAAALTAAHHGLDVLVVEKDAHIGGSTAISGGAVWIPQNPHLAEVGLSDSREAVTSYLRAILGNRYRGDMIEAFLDAGPRMVAFFEQHTEVAFAPRAVSPDYQPDLPGAAAGGRTIDPLPYDGRKLGPAFARLKPPLKEFLVFGGMMVNRKDIDTLLGAFRSPGNFISTLKLVGRYALDRLGHARGTRLLMGNALAARLLKSALDRSIPIRTGTRLVELLRDGSRITGVVVEADGQRLCLGARRGVVLATGGFPASSEARARLLPHAAHHASMAPATNAGEGIAAAEGVGGRMGTDTIGNAFWTPVSILTNPDGSQTRFPHLILDRQKPGLVAVDQTGRRFVNEATSYHEFVEAMHRRHETHPAIPAWLVCDAAFLRSYGLGLVRPGLRPLGRFIKAGYLIEAPNLTALAERMGVEHAAFAEAIAQMNRAAETGEDPVFGKGSTAYNRYLGDASHRPNPCLGPIATAPFYAVRVYPGDIGTAAGLITDTSARVLDAAGAPIPGLHAVGNDMHSIMAGAYPSAGITLGPALTFGYLAGLALADHKD